MKNFVWDKCQGITGFLYANNRPIVLSFVWVLFMLFFTYTALLVEAFTVDGNFYDLFYNTQCQYIALFVNAGIIVMLLFDNYASNKEFHGKETFIPIIGIVLCILIMAHCDCKVNNELSKYIKPIAYEKLSVVIYCLFIIMIYYLKARSLWDTVPQKKGVS